MSHLIIIVKKKKDEFEFTDEKISKYIDYFSLSLSLSGAFVNEQECVLRSHMNITLHTEISHTVC